jgi:hypothetical protein
MFIENMRFVIALVLGNLMGNEDESFPPKQGKGFLNHR